MAQESPSRARRRSKAPSSFGTRLSALRRSRGMTQAELAAAAGISTGMVTAYEIRNANPPVNVLPRLARALGVATDELLRGVESGSAGRARTVERRRKVKRRNEEKDGDQSKPPKGFGERLAVLRRARGLRQRDFGAAVGLSQRMVAYYEAQGGNPPASLLPRFADALCVSLDELFGRSTNHQRAAPDNLRLWRRFRAIEELSPEDRKAVLRHIRGLLRSRPEPRPSSP